MLVMLADKHTRNCCLLSDPSDNRVRGVPTQDALARTTLWSMMMKAFPSRNGCWDAKKADGNASGQLAPFPQVSICPPPSKATNPMVTLLLNWSKVIIQPMKDGNGKRTFKLEPIVTMSCHPWNSNTKVKQNPLNPPQQDSPIPCMPSNQSPWKLTPGPHGTRWSVDLFREPSQHDEPPILGVSQPSEPHEDALTCGPEPDVAPTQSMEETFF
ncbi:hypothetical protein O181_011518 [Austropuccinia psidii MF-1]|uniref:Uncharacterized protein n=1 Tax=Austropuccinia psidii MF-1 TaxID=1389203 RepID=A0A9Q3GLC5_9BASI|nr:hypothetical protein [Austropuccinia psidii MF-1]